jgi:cation diffusion facilitator family transporter
MSAKQQVAAISIVASGSMAALKFGVGVAIGSLALISEALHSLVDFGATIITWLVVRVSDQPADDEHHYGHGKIENLSALGVTALLYVLAGGIAVEAVGRLRAGTIPPTLGVLPFAVLIIDIGINLWRARALMRVAKETSSQALEADALHFTSDVYGAIAVIAGLALTGLGFAWGDSAAALAVAVAISLLGLKLTRSTIEALVDRAPAGAAERATAAIAGISGVIGVERLRLRLVGKTHFIDAAVKVPRTFPIDRIEEIKRRAQTAVNDALGEADLTFTAVPVARSNESARERIMLISRNLGLAIHHVTIHDLSERLIVSIDLEVDGEMSLDAAHDITHRLENAIRDDLGADVEVDTHIEPLEPELPRGTDAPSSRIDAIRTALVGLAERLGNAPRGEGLDDIHNVRVRQTEAGEIVNFHCRGGGARTVTEIHNLADELERALKRAFPSVRRVISHVEPRR